MLSLSFVCSRGAEGIRSQPRRLLYNGTGSATLYAGR